ncbi:composite domain of metallo-dependent hydrolase [Punctularia strigosozonata HHB-11173 SS5]|uniref:composite domain of metallo-dependent hydrolase n=1 Tax=Punctularia strigosozonata (strain HHB-11173) TaxID=741275 RepID=UPI000441837F|nr:composite domain of metallo-dependent hydrolase [Punctularia strigosozonata HHB-11173 SS5]EIN11328.1 composite domain of metallo-dependent hydrolase [Punctularia strigosozonata HHB-11173 SS5]
MDLKLPVTNAVAAERAYEKKRRALRLGGLPQLVLTVVLLVAGANIFGSSLNFDSTPSVRVPVHAQENLAKCKALAVKPGPPEGFEYRTVSDRFVPGTKPVLIRNATIWTGHNGGNEIVLGDLLLENGIIKGIGKKIAFDTLKNVDVYEANGAWVTPGIVDLHSHLGVGSAPSLSGAGDTNSRKAPILPWLRSLDGLNTHDDAYLLSLSGGVTTALVLPGSANSIGGQAFPIKLRPTAQRTPTSMLLELPLGLTNGTGWRQMKHACGENIRRVHDQTRMDNLWGLRQAYNHARQIKEKQDAYCEKAFAGEWNGLGEFPEDLQWEALVDVLRNKVKVQNHCYETVDLDDMIRLTQEFKFSIAAFHHAHETYLVPDRLKEAYGHPPAIAMFATNARYKRESYRGSEFAPKVLAEAGLDVVMKSDHPVLNSRHLLFEAQQAHYYGLPANLAIASVTATPARIMGYDHRVGFLKAGHDADVVVWDSHPLALGATPRQVWVDGIPQIKNAHGHTKPPAFQNVPKTPNFDKEANRTLEYDGLPPLDVNNVTSGRVIFRNVKTLYGQDNARVSQLMNSADGQTGVAVLEDGKLVCYSSENDCNHFTSQTATIVDLEGGSLAPGLISVGSQLGLEEIRGEPSTQDGNVHDPLSGPVPKIVGGDYAVIRAVDGLQFATRDALLAYRSGVTAAVTAPKSNGFLRGLSTVLSTRAAHGLEAGAIIQEEAALHIAIGHRNSGPSISTQIATLRRLLHGEADASLAKLFSEIVQGDRTLVIDVQNADIMTSLILLKREVEGNTGKRLKFTFSGALEVHLLAKDIGEADIGVLLNPVRPFPGTWESRRILPGPPLTKHSSLSLLLEHNVTVALGVTESWEARNTRLNLAWAALESTTDLSRSEALALATTNIEKLLGLKATLGEFVITRGGDLLDMDSQVVAVASAQQNAVYFV